MNYINSNKRMLFSGNAQSLKVGFVEIYFFNLRERQLEERLTWIGAYLTFKT